MAKAGAARVGKQMAGAAVDGALEQAHTDARFFVTLVSRFVSYQEFFEKCGVDEFRGVLGVAVYDQFTRLDEEKKASKLALSPEQVASHRLHPIFERVKERLLEEARRLSLPRSLDQWAEVYEDLAARDSMLLATVATKPLERLAAIKEMGDRRSAKKGREQRQLVLMLPANLLREIEAGMKAIEITGGSDEDEIDAGVLNVPRLIGSGTTGE